MISLALAIRGGREASFAAAVAAAPDLEIVRRCVDLAELVSVAAAGIASVAVISADMPGLDRSLLAELSSHGVAVVGAHDPDDSAERQLLENLGIAATLALGAESSAVANAVSRAHTDLRRSDDTQTGRFGPTTGAADAGFGSASPTGDKVSGSGGADTGRSSDSIDAGTGTESLQDRWGADRSKSLGDAPAQAYDSAGTAARSGSEHRAGRSARPEGAEWDGEPLAGTAHEMAAKQGDGFGVTGDAVDGQRPDQRVEPAPDRGTAVPATVIAVWGPTGAPGRSFLAVNIAAEACSLGRRVLLIDADPYGGVLAQSLALLDEAPGLAAAIRACDQGRLDLAELARLAPEALPGMRVLTGLPKAERWPELRPAPMETVLDLSRRLVDVVVLDLGFNIEDDEELSYDTFAPRRNAATLVGLERADQVVVVGSGDPIGLQRLVRAVQEMGSVRVPGERTVVVNRVRAGAVGGDPEVRIASALDRFAGVDGVHLVPEDRGGADAALLAGQTLAEAVPNSPARAAIRRVTAHLLGEPADAVRRRAGVARIVRRRSA